MSENDSKEKFSSLIDLAIKLTNQQTDLLEKQNKDTPPINRLPINFHDMLNKNIQYVMNQYSQFSKQFPALVQTQAPKQEMSTQQFLNKERSKEHPFSSTGSSKLRNLSNNKMNNRLNLSFNEETNMKYSSNAYWKKIAKIGDENKVDKNGIDVDVDVNGDGLCDNCGSEIDTEFNFCNQCNYLKPTCSCGSDSVDVSCNNGRHTGAIIKRASLIPTLIGSAIGGVAGNLLSSDD